MNNLTANGVPHLLERPFKKVQTLAVKLFMLGAHHIEPFSKILLSEQAPTQHFAKWFCMAELLLQYMEIVRKI